MNSSNPPHIERMHNIAKIATEMSDRDFYGTPEDSWLAYLDFKKHVVETIAESENREETITRMYADLPNSEKVIEALLGYKDDLERLIPVIECLEDTIYWAESTAHVESLVDAVRRHEHEPSSLDTALHYIKETAYWTEDPDATKKVASVATKYRGNALEAVMRTIGPIYRTRDEVKKVADVFDKGVEKDPLLKEFLDLLESGATDRSYEGSIRYIVENSI